MGNLLESLRTRRDTLVGLLKGGGYNAIDASVEFSLGYDESIQNEIDYLNSVLAQFENTDC